MPKIISGRRPEKSPSTRAGFCVRVSSVPQASVSVRRAAKILCMQYGCIEFPHIFGDNKNATANPCTPVRFWASPPFFRTI